VLVAVGQSAHLQVGAWDAGPGVLVNEHRPHRPCRDRVGRTKATSTSAPLAVSSSTFSIIVCATPSTDRHTLTARNAVPS
jgi:hypothetical protein